MARRRLRELGISTGTLPPGRLNAITDVGGVGVGYATVLRETPHIVRSGVTAIWPRGSEIWTDYVFAGFHSFNGNGEMTGLPWIAEQGYIGAPICITNTYQVGIVRDAICALAVRDGASQDFHLPVVAETYDGWLNNIQSFPLTQADAFRALDGAVFGGAIAEGNVGGGTGMICHEFKGGTGTASRIVEADGASYTVGALVQANYGARDLLRIDGVPVGREIGPDIVPSHRAIPRDAGSIIVILATDAPLLPIQCQRLARRATTGLAWVGGIGANSSGDIFLAFSTGNHIGQKDRVSHVRMLAADAMTGLFRAAAEATEEAILNALCMAETMTGRDGRIVHALPLDGLQEVMRRYGRG
ncbi:MAG TPA: P1 family peptidase [Stellaceae bacterium]|nr:P1 family peptidase [Stellaceae bacterium]